MPSMTLCIQCLADIGYLSDSEGRSNKTIIFTTYRERHCGHCVCVFPKVHITIKSEFTKNDPCKGCMTRC
jgi:hypothetical protein